jgi:thiol-disulfide isomerase/thioredoxin
MKSVLIADARTFIRLKRVFAMKWLKRIAALACVAVPALSLAGCNQQAQATPAPGFTLEDLSGKTVSLSDFAGTPVLLHFGTTWCPPCIAEIPDLNRIHGEYEGRLVILYVDVQEDAGTVRKLVEDRGIRYPTVLDANGEVATRYGVVAFPTNILVDRDGQVVSRKTGVDEAAIKKAVGA